MVTFTSSDGARRLLLYSVLARLPLAMLSVGLLVQAEHLTGSFATAGAVAGAYAVALGIGGPLLGRLVDRHGQRAVLHTSAAASAVLLIVVAVLPTGVPAMAPVLLAAAIGIATPPVGASLRALLAVIFPDERALRSAYAVEASAAELTWITGPPLALGVGVLWAPGAALAVAGLTLLLATVAFARQPASREWRPSPDALRPRGGSLGSPAMRTLVIVLLAVGLLFGAVEIAVTAAADAHGGSIAAAAPLLALWGAGSLAGGLLAARLGGGATSATGLAAVLAALAVSHLALAAVADGLATLGVLLFVAGAAIAPTYATVYAMVDRAAPAGTATEAFAWLATAIGVGAAAGAAGAGALAEHAGPAAAFALAGAAGAIALLVTLLRSHSLAIGEAVPAPAPVAIAPATA